MNGPLRERRLESVDDCRHGPGLVIAMLVKDSPEEVLQGGGLGFPGYPARVAAADAIDGGLLLAHPGFGCGLPRGIAGAGITEVGQQIPFDVLSLVSRMVFGRIS